MCERDPEVLRTAGHTSSYLRPQLDFPQLEGITITLNTKMNSNLSGPQKNDLLSRLLAKNVLVYLLGTCRGSL